MLMLVNIHVAMLKWPNQSYMHSDEVLFIKPNYIPEKRKFPGILCFRQQRVRRVTISLSAR